jgi:hypothetical protein
MVLAAIEMKATDKDLARWLAIRVKSVPIAKWRAKERVKAAEK